MTEPSEGDQSTMHVCYTRVDFTPGQDMSSGTQRALQAGALLFPSSAAAESLTCLLARRQGFLKEWMKPGLAAYEQFQAERATTKAIRNGHSPLTSRPRNALSALSGDSSASMQGTTLWFDAVPGSVLAEGSG